MSRRPVTDPDVPVPGRLPPEVIKAYLARARAAAVAQGLPEHVTDPAVLDRIAGLVLAGRPRQPPARRSRASQPGPADSDDRPRAPGTIDTDRSSEVRGGGRPVT